MILKTVQEIVVRNTGSRSDVFAISYFKQHDFRFEVIARDGLMRAIAPVG
jgi:hypothetical protein